MRGWPLALLALWAAAAASRDTDLSGLVVVVLDQSNAFHASRAEAKRADWAREWDGNEMPTVLLSHDLDVPGAWTIVPLFPLLSSLHPTARWFMFLEEDTEVDWLVLAAMLDSHSHEEALFLGHGLRDEERTILHHYVAGGYGALVYPCLACGWLLSAPALYRAAAHYKTFGPDFNIDAAYELALFLKYLQTPSLDTLFPSPPPAHAQGLLLEHAPQLCAESRLSGSCATAAPQAIPHCGEPMALDSVFFAVKTCEKFHATRVPVVQRTWADQTGGSITFYSELADASIPTVATGVANVVRGHCGKLMAILDDFLRRPELRQRQWLVVADDDTLLSVPRLLQLLACYDPGQPLLLGERYGYHAHRHHGSSYVTGGGGMVLSRELVMQLHSLGAMADGCPAPDSPDDMILGGLVPVVGGAIVHSPLFHQSQPSSYPPTLLKLQTAISFHRHTPEDPLRVYQRHLSDEAQSARHTEL